MGKKRRYIHRTKKFSKKAFNFLDKLDNLTADGNLKSTKIDTHISRLIVTDRGNQTISFEARCHGPGDGGDNLQADHVIYTIDGVTLHGDAVILIDHNGSGRDKFLAKTLNSPGLGSARAAAIAGANNTDVVLTPGEHTVSAIIYSEDEGTAKSEAFVKTFNVNRAEIVIGGLDAAFTVDNTNGQVDLNLGNITVSGKRAGEEAVYDPTNTAKDSFIVACVDSNGDAVALATAKTTKAENAARTDADTDILNAAIGAGTSKTLTFTFTPRDSSNAALTADAESVTLTVTRPA